MRTTDILLAIFIFLVFIGLYMINVLAIGVKSIRDNWPEYRCNPMVMPFASTLGPQGTSASDNFVFCVQNMQTNYMEYLLKPLNYSLNAMGSVAGSLSSSIFRLFKNSNNEHN
jgi:predicted PurR-regulated permease PerM